MDKPIPEAVAWPFSILEAGNWREVYMGTKHMRLEVSYPYEAWERLMAALTAAQQQQGQAVALPKLKRTHPSYSREEVQWVFGYNAALDDVMRLNKNTALAQQPAPPSAPVGVKTLSEFMAEQEALHPGIHDKVQAATDELRASLAQQPEAVDGVLAAVRAEVVRATAKFPTWPTDPLHASGVVQEESGELAKAVLQAVYEPHKSNPEDVAAEAVQTAAMAVRFLLSMDRYQWQRGEQHAQNALAAQPGGSDNDR